MISSPEQNTLRAPVRTYLAAGLLGSCFLASSAFATLTAIEAVTGNVGMSIDAAGSNGTPAGTLQAEIPVGATVTKAYLYAAGTPYPWYPNVANPASPQTAAEYNAAGISVGGTSITNFDTIVGAVSDRVNLGEWFTGRADVTSVVQGLQAADPGASSYNWDYIEGGNLNNRIDGAVLAVIYEHPSLPVSTVAFLDGGQKTGGETTTVNFASPLTGTGAPGFFANMSLGISFSVTSSQTSLVDINGTRLTSSAGGFDDGTSGDGGLITAGGIGDSTANPAAPFSNSSPDDELYDLTPFLSDGDTSFDIFTKNDSNDDNIFFMGLHISAEIKDINDENPNDPSVPEPAAAIWIGLTGLGALFALRRRQR